MWQQLAHVQKPEWIKLLEFDIVDIIFNLTFSDDDIDGRALLLNLANKWNNIPLEAASESFFKARLYSQEQIDARLPKDSRALPPGGNVDDHSEEEVAGQLGNVDRPSSAMDVDHPTLEAPLAVPTLHSSSTHNERAATSPDHAMAPVVHPWHAVRSSDAMDDSEDRTGPSPGPDHELSSMEEDEPPHVPSPLPPLTTELPHALNALSLTGLPTLPSSAGSLPLPERMSPPPPPEPLAVADAAPSSSSPSTLHPSGNNPIGPPFVESTPVREDDRGTTEPPEQQSPPQGSQKSVGSSAPTSAKGGRASIDSDEEELTLSPSALNIDGFHPPDPMSPGPNLDADIPVSLQPLRMSNCNSKPYSRQTLMFPPRMSCS